MLLNICCYDGGTFYLSEESKAYMIDTTITSFEMVDSNGMTEGFYIPQDPFETQHHYFNDYGNGIIEESFNVQYNSTLNYYIFDFLLRAIDDSTFLNIEWNQKDRFDYNLRTGEIEYGIAPKLSFHDSLTVRGVEYKDIIEIDYYSRIEDTDIDTPIKNLYVRRKRLN